MKTPMGEARGAAEIFTLAHPQSLPMGRTKAATWTLPPRLPYGDDIIGTVKDSRDLLLFVFTAQVADYSCGFQTGSAGEGAPASFLIFTTAQMRTQSIDWHTQTAPRLFGWLDRCFETEQSNIIGRTYDILAADRTTPCENLERGPAWAALPAWSQYLADLVACGLSQQMSRLIDYQVVFIFPLFIVSSVFFLLKHHIKL